VTREKALEAMDRFVEMGYCVVLTTRDMGAHGHVMIDPETKEMTSIVRHLEIAELGLDKVDLNAIVQTADDLGIEAGLNSISGRITLTDQPSEEERRRREVIDSRRAHPRGEVRVRRPGEK
jgi:hypothetical protein